MEGVDAFFCDPVPEFDGLIVAAGHDESSVGGEPRLADPVGVSIKTELESLSVNSPQLEKKRKTNAWYKLVKQKAKFKNNNK